ncbi:MAG: hypothetical protein KF852_20860 [Saprospiraceae bacterium]|nr:hypothetical protein [Saprospiraceae bacterium]
MIQKFVFCSGCIRFVDVNYSEGLVDLSLLPQISYVSPTFSKSYAQNFPARGIYDHFQQTFDLSEVIPDFDAFALLVRVLF